MNAVDENAAGMPSGRFFVLYRLANRATDHSGEDWTCFPSIETQAADTHLSRSAVERHLADLVAEGWLSRKRRVRPDGKLGIYDYWIHRSAARREALKAARAAIAELGEKPAETLEDLEHPCCKTLHGPCGDLQHGPCGDLNAAMLQFAAEPCGNSPHHEHKGEPKREPTHGAREPGDQGFDELIEAWPESGAKRTRWPAARAAFARICDEIAAADLVAAVKACAADPDMRRGDHGWPGLHSWLADERWRFYLRRSSAGAAAGSPGGDAANAETRTPFVLPADLAQALEADLDALGTWLHRATWSADDRTICAATSIARDRLVERIGRRRLAELNINIAWGREHGGGNAA